MDAGEVVPAGQTAAAGLLVDLCAFQMFVGFELDQDLLDVLGSHKKSGGPESLDELLAVRGIDLVPSPVFSGRISERLASFTKIVATGTDVERAGAVGGLTIGRLRTELMADRYGDPGPSASLPAREWASAVQTLAKLAVKVGVGTR
jgi:hypothetical protein